MWGVSGGNVTGPFRGLGKVILVPKNASSVVEEKDMEVQSGFAKLNRNLLVYSHVITRNNCLSVFHSFHKTYVTCEFN